MTAARIAQAVRMRDEGQSVRSIAATLGVSKSSVDRALRAHDAAAAVVGETKQEQLA